MSETRIRTADSGDAERIAEIYNHYIQNTVITFEESSVSPSEMAKRIAETQNEGLPYLVAEANDAVAGYAYASKWKGRCAYRYTVEATVYLHPDATGQNLGTKLYTELFAQLAEQNYHQVIGGISLPNEGSVALHEKFGMKKVAHLPEVGYKFDRWVDVGYWQGTIQRG